jgi:hypothetical protein
MTWLSALGVLAAAASLIAIQRRLQKSQFNWIQAAVHAVNPQSYAALAAPAEEELDLAGLDYVPEMLRPLCPAPPFVAAVYHHTCGSCRELWREIGTTDDLSAIHMVHSASRTEQLRRTGILRQPAVALPDEIMESLPSGLAIRVDAGWRIADIQMATTTGDLRQLLHESAVSL